MGNRIEKNIIILLLLFFIISSCTSHVPEIFDTISATLLLKNGQTWSGGSPKLEASAVAISNHKLEVVGGNSDIQIFSNKNTETVNLQDSRVVPCFIGAHLYFITLAHPQKLTTNLQSVTFEEYFTKKEGKVCSNLPMGKWFAGSLCASYKWRNPTYPFRNFSDTRTILTFGSGRGMSLIYRIYCAVTRTVEDEKTPAGWFPHQKITVEKALKVDARVTAYTSNFEDKTGALVVGERANLVVLNTDILSVALGKNMQYKSFAYCNGWRERLCCTRI
jgi:predicted amidohydrolase YtcJ